MKQGIWTVTKNERIARDVYRMVLTGDPDTEIRPGQFVNISLPGLFLRRPISVCDREGDALTLIYKVVGKGTGLMQTLRPADGISHAEGAVGTAGVPAGQESPVSLDLLTGLGNGYDLSKAGEMPLLLGGGVGVPPLYLLAKKLREAGKNVTAVLGFNTRDEVFYEAEFRALGCGVTVTTVDGSYGKKGFVTDALPESYSYFYTCGPLPMLRAVYRAAVTEGQFSLEERMGCGFGACMGCSIQTKNGPARVCREGPVFEKDALLF